jgi:hypothetical protein
MSTARTAAPRRRRAAPALAAALGAALLGACGGSGGGPGAGATPAAPAAAIDRSSGNVITGPVNRARTVAGDQEAHDRALEEQSGGGQP